METALDAREARKMFDENLKKVCNQVLENFYRDVKIASKNCQCEIIISFDSEHIQDEVCCTLLGMDYIIEDIEDMGGHCLIRW